MRPEINDLFTNSPNLKAYWQQYDSLIFIDNIIYRKFYDATSDDYHLQLLILMSMRNSVLQLILTDACCHMKNLNTFLRQVSRRAYWYSWRRDSEIFLRTGLRCQQYFWGNPPRQGGLKPQIGLASMPGERYSIDLVRPATQSRFEIYFHRRRKF
jgi:hypothetical protein